MTKLGRTMALYGMTGSGKTTQLGEAAKWVKAQTGRRTQLCSADPGGYDSIEHLVDEGLVEVIRPGDENPWVWIQRMACEDPPTDVGLRCFDSATGMGDMLLANAADLASKGIQVGQEKAYNLKITGTPLVVGANNKSQYGLIQNFMLARIGAASQLAARTDTDVIWTFGEQYPEPGEAALIGPKLVGKALTTALPRHIRYTLRLVEVPEVDGPPRHKLITQSTYEADGLTRSLVNCRWPWNDTIACPTAIDPASIPAFWDLIQSAKEAATSQL